MKRLTRILSLVLVAAVCFTLAACGNTLSGKYKGSIGVSGLAESTALYEFSGKKVKLTVTGTLVGQQDTSVYEGTYEIKDNEEKDGLVIVLTFTGDDSSYSGTFSFSKGKNADGVEFIKIGSLTYNKQK